MKIKIKKMPKLLRIIITFLVVFTHLYVSGEINEADISPLQGGEENVKLEESFEGVAASSHARLLRIRRSFGESMTLQEHSTFVKGIHDLFTSNAL